MVFRFFRKQVELTKEDVAEARAYIDNYWSNLTIYHPKNKNSLLGLPNKYLVPANDADHEYDFSEMYYWDSYFMIQGFLKDQRHKKLVLGMLDNLIYMFNKFDTIPNASRTYFMGRSQPPLLTSFIWDVYEAYNMGQEWLGENLKVAMKEYKTVWMGSRKPNHRQVYHKLSRYYDINVLHDLAEAESGWDMTPRFNRKCLNYLPADLNSLLYKYETDFARYYRMVAKHRKAAHWEARARHRKKQIDNFMWSNLRAFYYDYNYIKKRRSTLASLAGFYPLWAGMVDKPRAAQLVRALRRFDNKGGLTTTEVLQLNFPMPGAMPAQWAYPNGWAPLHFLVVKGLQRYGYHEDARRIAMKWLKTNLDWFKKHGVFLEKYNVVRPNDPPAKGVYPSPTGFGWTNAVFERFCQDFIDEQQSK